MDIQRWHLLGWISHTAASGLLTPSAALDVVSFVARSRLYSLDRPLQGRQGRCSVSFQPERLVLPVWFPEVADLLGVRHCTTIRLAMLAHENSRQADLD